MPTARIELAAGTYDVTINGTPSTVTVPTLTAGSIDNVSPTEGDTLTVTAGNETATATYQWQKDGVNITGATSASLDTTGEGVGDYRRGVSDGLQGPVYTAAVTVAAAAAATVPSQMSAPTLAVNSASQITATLAADPADGGSPITSYDLRYSTDEATWTDVIGVTSPHAITGLTASTLYYVQTRAVNAVGAGAWSASATATTTAASAVFFTDDFSTDTSANYTAIVGAGTLVVSGGQAQATGGGVIAAQDVPSTPDRHEIIITIGAASQVNEDYILIGRNSDGFNSRVALEYDPRTFNVLYLRYVANATATVEAAFFEVTLSAGDKMRLRIDNALNTATGSYSTDGGATWNTPAGFADVDVSPVPVATRWGFRVSDVCFVNDVTVDSF